MVINQIAIFRNAFVLVFITLAVVSCQDCLRSGCPGLEECCSDWGYCNVTGSEHCNFVCHSGPCDLTYSGAHGITYSASVSDGPRGKIESIVTQALFDRIMIKVGSNCPAKGFYTRKAFIAAAKTFGAYKGTVAKREIAAMLTHFSHGSKSFCYKEKKAKEKYCSKSKKYTCESGKSYHGRGPLQVIRWNEYYGAAGKFLGLPLLKDPDMVTRDPEVAFKFAIWYWNKYVRPALYLGFQGTSKRVDGGLCVPNDMENLVKQYVELCKILGLTPEENIDPYC